VLPPWLNAVCPHDCVVCGEDGIREDGEKEVLEEPGCFNPVHTCRAIT
jgi:hypothetical protein